MQPQSEHNQEHQNVPNILMQRADTVRSAVRHLVEVTNRYPEIVPHVAVQPAEQLRYVDDRPEAVSQQPSERPELVAQQPVTNDETSRLDALRGQVDEVFESMDYEELSNAA